MSITPSNPPRPFLTALPVYNEVATVDAVLDQVVQHSPRVLVIDDGSDDGTSERLAKRDDILVVTHPENRGYGAALQTAFQYAIEHNDPVVVTIDCDGQHEPQRIRQFVDALHHTGADIISGSRYLKTFASDTPAPEDRRRINQRITQLLNQKLGLNLTDAFCGFKAYRTEALKQLTLTEPGYGMPLELWVQAACHGLSIVELGVPLIYLDEKRSFGEQLDDPNARWNYYMDILKRAFAALPSSCTETIGDSIGQF